VITLTKSSNPIALRIEYPNSLLRRSTRCDSKLPNHWWRSSFRTASTRSCRSSSVKTSGTRDSQEISQAVRGGVPCVHAPAILADIAVRDCVAGRFPVGWNPRDAFKPRGIGCSARLSVAATEAAQASSSRSILASFRSEVSKPSANQP